MQSFMPKRKWKIGHVINTPEDASYICDNTQLKVLIYLLDKFDTTKERGTFYAKPVGIWVKSPLNDLQIGHNTVMVKINGELYLYDMPQSEYIKYIKENEGVVVHEYKPRLIKYTKENIRNLYQVDESHLNLLFKDEYIGEGLIDVREYFKHFNDESLKCKNCDNSDNAVCVSKEPNFKSEQSEKQLNKQNKKHFNKL